MVGNVFAALDVAVRPRVGQSVMLDYHGHRIRGSVHSLSSDFLRILPDSTLLARQLRAGTRLKATLITAHGIVGATLGMIGVHGDFMTMQLIGQPALLQRRSDPRVKATLGITLVWSTPRIGTLHQLEGRTQNVSLGGALARFAAPHPEMPGEHVAMLLGLELPDGAVSVAVRVLQSWDGGARLRFVDPAADVIDQLSRFVESGLR